MLKETLIYILSFLKQLQAGCELSFRGTNAGSLFFQYQTPNRRG